MAGSDDASPPRPKLEPVVRDPELWQALGQLTIYYAMLEGQLKFNIWLMLRKEDEISTLAEIQEQEAAQIVMAGRPFSTLIDMFCSLSKLRGADPGQLGIVRKDLERVSVERNRYVHSEWGSGTKPGAVTRYRHTAKAKNGLKFSGEQVTPADVRALADDIGLVTLRVAGVLWKGPGFHQNLWESS
jgi:hypothetical protein